MLHESQYPSFFTVTSAYSLAGVAAIALVAYTASRVLLSKNARWQDRFTFIWLVRGDIVSFTSSRLPAANAIPYFRTDL